MIDVRQVVNSGRLIPKRALGQCFLTERVLAEKIAKAAGLTSGDHVIEVGPGVCALTGYLCEQAGTVIAVEIDRSLTAIINEVMSGYDNFKLINADILKIPAGLLLPQSGTQSYKQSIPALVNYSMVNPAYANSSSDNHKIKGRRAILISNLPYNITTPIMTRLFEEFSFIDKAVLMMQKEVAEKLLAAPSTVNYCLLTVFARFFCDPRKLFAVPPHYFAPQPGVESVVMLLDAHHPPIFSTSEDRQMFFRVARAAFAQRRKTIENSLMLAGLVANRPQADKIVSLAGVPCGARGESLDITEFAALARALMEM